VHNTRGRLQFGGPQNIRRVHLLAELVLSDCTELSATMLQQLVQPFQVGLSGFYESITELLCRSAPVPIGYCVPRMVLNNCHSDVPIRYFHGIPEQG
jgi:hypothetical protein